jgi:hypothetical protein
MQNSKHDEQQAKSLVDSQTDKHQIQSLPKHLSDIVASKTSKQNKATVCFLSILPS